MARKIFYPNGWPGTKRRDKAAGPAKANPAAMAYLTQRANLLKKGLVGSTLLTETTEMSNYG